MSALILENLRKKLDEDKAAWESLLEGGGLSLIDIATYKYALKYVKELLEFIGR